MNYLKVFKNQEQTQRYLSAFEGSPDFIVRHPRNVVDLSSGDKYICFTCTSDPNCLAGLEFKSIEFFYSVDIETYQFLRSRLR